MSKNLEGFKKESKIRFTEQRRSTKLDGAVKINFEKYGLAAIEPVTITDFFQNCCKHYGQRPALAFKATQNREFNKESNQENWTVLTYAEYLAKVQNLAHMLIHIGLKPRMAVGILANNCPEWFFLQFAILQAGGVVFGIHPKCSSDSVYHKLAITEATICIVDNTEQFRKVYAVCNRLPNLKVILQLHGVCEDFKHIEPSYYCWNDLLKISFSNELSEELKERQRNQFVNECAMIVFTSGAVGKPKAILLSHDNIIYNVKAVYNSQTNVCWGEGRIVSYLPLSHIAAQAFEIFAALLTGACVYFAKGDALKGTLIQTLREVKPTMFLGVPRIYEKLQERLLVEQKRKGILSKFIENRARDAVTLNNFCESMCSVPVTIKDTFANYIINNTRKVLGMECCRIFFCGGAPLSPKIKRYFGKFDVAIIDIYGLSELSGPATMNCSKLKLRSLGKPIDGTKILLKKVNRKEKQGEILFSGRHVFMGYLNDSLATAAAIDKNGWLHTGDLGFIDRDGYLFNVGRKREVIITLGGEKVDPVPIEEALKKEMPALSNAMVIGDKRNYLTVLLTLKTEIEPSNGLPTDILHTDTKAWLRSLSYNFTKLSTILETFKDRKKSKVSWRITQSILMVIECVNRRALPNAQQIQKFLLLRRDFSVATGELAPSLKIRRSFVLEKYAKKIDEMYG